MLFDYTTLSAESVRADADRSLAEADDLVTSIVEGTAADPLDTLDEMDDVVGSAYGRTAFMGYVHPDAEVRQVGKEIEERIQKWGVEVVFRDDFYAAIKGYSETPAARSLAGERARLLEFVMRDLRKAGHELSPEDRAEVKRLTQRLVELGVAFERNIAEDSRAVVVDDAGLEGLPDSFREGLQPGDEPGTYRVTTAYPDYFPFMENGRRRDLRRQMRLAFDSRAIEVNRPILEEAVAIRSKIAGIFGQESWAEHQLEERMAKEPGAVHAFYEGLVPPLTDKGLMEKSVMSDMLKTDEHDGELQAFDWRYYGNRIRLRDYGVDPMEIAAYFPLQAVLDGMLDLTGEVFGLQYGRVEAPTWHPDVQTYAIEDADTGETIAHFHMDLFPREGKFSHAAAFPLVPGRLMADGNYQQPVSAIVANMTKPTSTQPSLLQHSEVVVLFHEFGHILHQTLTKAATTRFAGSSTETDFVEAPSQIMENWTWEPSVLQRFARHYATGDPIPPDLVDRMVAARRLNIGITTLRQIQLGMLDLELHGPGHDKDIEEITRRINEVTLLPYQEGTFFPASFGHLFGYDAGYYGYLWAEVFGDDMWSRFAEEGVTNSEVGRSYRREILEKGGSADGGELLRNFLGRQPSNQAFLHKLGID
jgi:thimet oligopeptidase